MRTPSFSWTRHYYFINSSFYKIQTFRDTTVLYLIQANFIVWASKGELRDSRCMILFKVREPAFSNWHHFVSRESVTLIGSFVEESRGRWANDEEGRSGDSLSRSPEREEGKILVSRWERRGRGKGEKGKCERVRIARERGEGKRQQNGRGRGQKILEARWVSLCVPQRSTIDRDW